MFWAARRETSRAKPLMSPVRTSPPDTMNIAAIVQGAGLEKTSMHPAGRHDADDHQHRRPEHRRHLDRIDLEHEDHEHDGEHAQA